jgi:two-component system, NarL family, sensor histidine kinase DesK
VTDVRLPPTPAAASLARGVRATWWYTAGSVLMFQALTLLMWSLPVLVELNRGGTWIALVLYALAAAVSVGSSIPLLLRYARDAGLQAPEGRSRFSPTVAWSLAAAAVAALAVGVLTGSVLCGVSFAALSASLLRWAPGIRLRIVIALTLVLVVVWVWEGQNGVFDLPAGASFVYPFFSVILIPTAVLCLWWWDIVVALDRARGAEGRLAAAQERLRLAGDLHDLQGHHLQVIALQLELAERMLPRDPDAAIEQVRLARASVDEARQGTRELAGRFRGVPLPDELANAADLLRAAGLRVDLEVQASAADAPAEVLGPVVRESTTNVLKHGGGAWAELSLRRDDEGWRLRVANDPGAAASDGAAGSGLAGIGERVGAVGGTMVSEAADDRFEIVVTVPAAAGVRA